MRWVALGSALAGAFLSVATVAAQDPSASPDAGTVGGWVAVETPAFADFDAIEQAVSTGDEIVVVGTRCDADGTCERGVLATADGTTWSPRGALPAEVDLLADLVADGSDLYALGDDADGAAAIWRSPDRGSTWQLADLRAAQAGSADRRRRSGSDAIADRSVLALARGPDGLIAAGWFNAESHDRSALWRSDDGTTWDRLGLRRALDDAGGVFDLAGRSTAVVAVTGDGLWRSDDGSRWERVATIEDPEEILTDVEASDDGFVGLGVGPRGATIWEAGAEGEDWRREDADPALAGAWEAELRAFGPRIVAVGTRDGDERVPTVWLRDDGSWSAETISTATGAVPVDVATIGDTIVVVGSVPDSSGGTTAAAWLEPDAAG
jgi:hypothetical protein